MQSLDGVSTYQNSMNQTTGVTQNPETEAARAQALGVETAGTQGQPRVQETVQHVASIKQELLQLVRGSVFEGVVTAIKEDYVLLSLINGQAIGARLENGVNVQLGEPVLFEVQSNQDGQITLKQVDLVSQYNPTLQRALTAAGLPMTARNLEMVNAMMTKQMPIDKGSLAAMARQLQSYPEASVETLVQMKKLGFTVNESQIQQFTGYKEGHHSLVGRFSQMMEQLPEILDSFQNSGVREAGTGMAEQLLTLHSGLLEALEVSGGDSAGRSMQVAGQNTQAAGQSLVAGQSSQIPVGEFLSEQQLQKLEQQLRQIPGLEENPQLFDEGKLKESISAKEILRAVQQNLEQAVRNPEQWQTSIERSIKELFGGKEYKSLLKHVMEEQWLLKPQQAESKEAVGQLYERMNRQMEKLEQLLQNAGRETGALDKNVSQVRSNLEMMNQINQLYNYVQIPLKLQNQNAHSDLYVYTNKKKLMDKDGELSALLHLELEHLGTTDVQIKMLGNNLNTNFYFAEESSYQLVAQHIQTLQKHLEEKGYHCTMHLEHKEEKRDFVEDFLEHEMPLGKLQRYSFDVLA